MSRLPASSNTQPIATHDGILGSQASLPWHKTCFESRPSNSNFSVKLENNGSIVINDHDHFIILVSLVSSVVWCIMIVDTLLKCPARHNNNSLNNASTKFHQDSKPWRCGSLLHRSWASSVSTKLPFCLSQSLDIIPGPVAPYIWHHLTYLLDPLAQSCGKMLKESRGYINWHQLRIPTSNSHPKALKAPLKYHSKVETSELLGFLAITPPHTHTHTTLANRTSISTPRSVAIEEANDGAGRQRAQSSCPDS